MWNEPTERQLKNLPKLYETESIAVKDKVIYMHFFIGGCDWYAAEFDGVDTFFGFTILNNDYERGEWGYFSLDELKSIRVGGWCEVDRDLHWKQGPASEIDNLKRCRRAL